MAPQVWHKAIESARGIYSDFQEFLAPSVCLCCGRDRDFEDRFLCPGCIETLKSQNMGVGPVCPFCGQSTADNPCVSCHPPAELNLYYWGVYENELQECILQFKFHGARELGASLIELAYGLLVNRISQVRPDLIVPVPLHRKRRKQRRYNQSELLGEKLSVLMGIEFSANCLIRSHSTYQQAKLAEELRWRNVKDAFAVAPASEGEIIGKRILLVDDIVTTGATIYEASKALLSGGAARVDIFSLAYAV